jgi:hypothetical protein
MVGDRSENFAIDAVDYGVVGATHPRCVLRHRIQDRLQVGRRAGNDPQDLAGDGLLLQGFLQAGSEMVVLLLQACLTGLGRRQLQPQLRDPLLRVEVKVRFMSGHRTPLSPKTTALAGA